MIKNTFIHGISLLLALSLLLSLFSCSDGGEETSSDAQDIRLSVEQAEVKYSQELCDRISLEATEIAARFIRVSKGISVNEKQREELYGKMADDYLPLFEAENVSEEELDGILDAARELCSVLEELDRGEGDNTLSHRSDAFCALYRDLVAVIGTERTGRIGYNWLCIYLEDNIAHGREYYEKYGMEWYKTLADQSEKRLNALKEDVGIEVFAKAMSVPAFICSLSAGTILSDLQGSGITAFLNDGDTVAILRRQGDYFLSLGISEYQWLVIGEALSSVDTGEGDDLLGQILATYRDTGIMARAATCMPSFISLYESFADVLDASALASIRDAGAENERVQEVCRILVTCEDELLALCEKFKGACASATQEELDLIRGAGLLEELEAFESEYALLDADGLIAEIKECANGNGDAESLYGAWIGFLRTYTPYLAFAIDVENNT